MVLALPAPRDIPPALPPDQTYQLVMRPFTHLAHQGEDHSQGITVLHLAILHPTRGPLVIPDLDKTTTILDLIT